MRGRRRLDLNIGTVMFGALFLYLIIMIIVYLLSDHVSSYMVTSGTLSRNDTYTALALRQEQVARAPADGYVNYYVLDSGKAGKGSVVCSITGSRNELTTVRLSDSDMDSVRKTASQYSGNYRSVDFQSVYDMKYIINSSIVNNAETGAVNGMVSEAPVDGIVAYTMDGKEEWTSETVSYDAFSSGAEPMTQLRTPDEISAGDPLYRVISSERWSLLFPISDRQYAELSSRDQVKVRFAKDGNTESGDLSIFDRDGKHFALVTLYSGMVRYCGERYLDIELVTNTESGLKLPLSAIVTKEFYTIPASYLSAGGENGAAGFLLQTRAEDGSRTAVFTEAELYEKTTVSTPGDTAEEEVYYVDPQVFRKGDVVIQPDSQNTYTIGDSASLEGVYCTNRGYAVFRKIEIIAQNDDSCIVRTGTEYGLSQYDYIVRNGRDVKEKQIVSGSR